MKKGVLKNFAKLTGKTCARVSFSIKLQSSHLQLYEKGDSGKVFFNEFKRNF